MKNNKIKIAVIFGGSAVILGAFAAHGLKPILPSETLDSFKTGVHYQLIHSLFLLLLVSLDQKVNIRLPFYLTVIGIILFSISIYFLALDDYLGLDLGFLGPITPIGGLCLIVAWLSLLRPKKQSN